MSLIRSNETIDQLMGYYSTSEELHGQIYFMRYISVHDFHTTCKEVTISTKKIGRHFKGTKTKGLIMKPDKSKLQLDLYADTDFAG